MLKGNKERSRACSDRPMVLNAAVLLLLSGVVMLQADMERCFGGFSHVVLLILQLAGSLCQEIALT